MKQGRFIEDIDLDIARKITLNQALQYEILPLYESIENIYVISTNENEICKEFLSFIFNKNPLFIKRKREEVIRLINLVLDYEYEDIELRIFEEAIKSGASDIHFELIENTLNIRFRINGDLLLVRKLKKEEYLQIVSRLKVKANLDITEKRKPQDGKLYIEIDDITYNCRLSSIPVVGGEKIVIRVLYGDKFVENIDKLDFTKNQLEVVKKIVNLRNGMVIVNGPTGSGKSTTLYAILNQIKRDEINITTLEDSIEFTVNGLNQVNLNSKIGISFAEGIRSILRQDPDVIMVGEIRDEETAKMAIRAAITGHKVYSTIHTKSAREVYLRLEEMGVKEYLIRDALVGIISQRLIRVLCDKCKEKVGEIFINNRKVSIYKKNGCNYCNKSGYKGRTLVADVNYIDKNTKEDLKDIHNNEKILLNNQMIESLNELLILGSITYEDYLEFIDGEDLDDV